MPKSMTGYGRSKMLFGAREITVEIRSVNHKFFEFSSRVLGSTAILRTSLRLFSRLP